LKAEEKQAREYRRKLNLGDRSCLMLAPMFFR